MEISFQPLTSIGTGKTNFEETTLKPSSNFSDSTPYEIVHLDDEELSDILYQKNIEFSKRTIPTLTYISVLIVGGLVGNTLVSLVYFKRFKPSAMRTFIIAMSTSDLLINW